MKTDKYIHFDSSYNIDFSIFQKVKTSSIKQYNIKITINYYEPRKTVISQCHITNTFLINFMQK